MTTKRKPNLPETDHFRDIVRCSRLLVIRFRSGNPIHVQITALEQLFKKVSESFREGP